MNEYDLVVIGTGPGGYPAAIRASQLGLKVAAIENETIGGTCLNVGCIPSKTMLYFSELYAEALEHKALFGMADKASHFDFAALRLHKEKVIANLRASVAHLFKKNKIDLIQGSAQIASPHSVRASGQEIQAQNIILAAGSSPIELPFLPFDEKRVLSSTGALALDHIPRSMVVIGAGVIGVELASVFARLGTQVKVVELLPNICTGIDQELSKGLLSALKMEAEGIEFFLSTKVVSCQENAEGITLQLINESVGSFELTSEVVLVAVGRRPNSKNLGIDRVGITPMQNGCIPIDASFRTSVPSIYAIGDLIEGPMLAHRSTEEGIVVAEILAGKAAEIEYMCLPNVIYTFPECATVGLTEEEVKLTGREYKAAKASLRGNPRALACGYKEGFVKVIGDSKTDKLLGMHILSPCASEMIAIGMLAINQKMTVTALGDLPFAHPTLSEAIKEACLQISGKAIHY